MARAKKLWRPLKVWRPYEWVSFKKAWQRAEKVNWSNLRLMRRDLRQEFVDGRLVMAVRFLARDGTQRIIILERAAWQWLKINSASSITGWEAIPGWKADAHEEEMCVRRRELDKLYPDADTTGPAGPPGATGSQGPAGPVGPTGPQGPANLIGATGSQGPAGLVGPTGPQGLQGNLGTPGADGAVGPTGPAGATGPFGATGPAGATGPGFADAARAGRKPGPQARGDWPEHLMRELIGRALRAGYKLPKAPEMQEWCENTLGVELEIRQMQRFLLDLRTPKKFLSK